MGKTGESGHFAMLTKLNLQWNPGWRQYVLFAVLLRCFSGAIDENFESAGYKF